MLLDAIKLYRFLDRWQAAAFNGFEGVNAEGNHDNQGPLAFFSRPAEPISPPGPDGRPRHNRQTMQGGWSGDGRVQAVPGVSRGSVKYFTWWKSIGGRLEQKTGWTMHELYFEDRPELHLYKVFHKVAKRKSSSRPRTREAAMQEEADDDDASPSCNASAQAHPELWSAGNDPAAVPAMCGSASPVMLEGTLQENLAQRQRLAYFGTGPHGTGKSGHQAMKAHESSQQSVKADKTRSTAGNMFPTMLQRIGWQHVENRVACRGPVLPAFTGL
eukprot:jgi/Mesen1/4477/ME000228S03442